MQTRPTAKFLTTNVFATPTGAGETASQDTRCFLGIMDRFCWCCFLRIDGDHPRSTLRSFDLSARWAVGLVRHRHAQLRVVCGFHPPR